jgi:hypothetical protein
MVYKITITVFDIIHRQVFYLQHDVSETEFCLHLHVEPTQLGPRDRAGLCLRTPEVKAKVTLRPKVSRSVHLGVRPPPGTRDQFFFLLEILFRQLQVCYFIG